MVNRERFSVKGAVEYAVRGMIEEWVHEFLMTVGKNPEFSEGLKLQKRYWAGPVEFGLDKLTRCCGPEGNMEFKVDSKAFEICVGEMVKSLKKGWEAPPLIVQYHEGSLTLNDGNHRYEALKRCGTNRYWVIFWFNDLENYKKGMDELNLKAGEAQL